MRETNKFKLGLFVIFSIIVLIAAVFFIIQDSLTYPKLKAEIEAMEKQRDKLIAHSKADLPSA